MKTDWLKGAKTKEEREALKTYILDSEKVLDILRRICYTKLNELQVTTQVDYDNPSWAYLQAHRNGEIQAYRKVIELLNVSEDKTGP